jgi:hypothetical protein
MAADHPLDMLGLVSSMLDLLDPRHRTPFDPAPEAELPSRAELIQGFLDVPAPETSAMLAAIAGISGDEMLTRRVKRELVTRADALPRWLAELEDAKPAARAVEIVHVLGDGDNIVLGVELPGGAAFTAVVYIDHNVGTLVKDAFLVPEPVDALVERMLTVADDPDTQARDIDPADARARITEAIERASITYPPFESDSWPACRPLVEWAVGMLPTGGTGYETPEWDDESLAGIVERFLASPFGDGFDDPEHRDLIDTLIWFGTDYGPGDPLRWSAVAVEILMVDWIPRKIVAGADYLAKAPDLLRAFIRFSHRERGVRAALTEEVIHAVDLLEPEYQRVIRSARPQGPAALLAGLGLPDVDGVWDEPFDPHIGLKRVVGGDEALATLDTNPLPDEPFAWDGIPDDIHDRVAEVLALVDGCCAELELGVEARTACRRFLSRAAAGDPAIFRRRSKASTAAAAVCWVISKANGLFGSWGGRQAKELLAHFGVASASQRSQAFLRAVGGDPYDAEKVGSTDYLTADRRAKIIAIRDMYEVHDQ